MRDFTGVKLPLAKLPENTGFVEYQTTFEGAADVAVSEVVLQPSDKLYVSELALY